MSPRRSWPLEIDLWQHRVAQLKKQIDDQSFRPPDYGYEEMTLQDGKGTKRTPLEELIRWRLWNRTGGGLMVELGSHQLDAAGIFITADLDEGHKVLPLAVQAVGGRCIFPPDRDVADHVYCMYEYPGKGYYKDYEKGEIGDPNKKIVVTYSSINGNGFGGYGETVLGTAGTLLLERNRRPCSTRDRRRSSRVTVKTERQRSDARHDRKRCAGAGGRLGQGGRRTRQPRLYRGDRALGLVHPQPRFGQQAALRTESRSGRRGHRADQ